MKIIFCDINENFTKAIAKQSKYHRNNKYNYEIYNGNIKKIPITTNEIAWVSPIKLLTPPINFSMIQKLIEQSFQGCF